MAEVRIPNLWSHIACLQLFDQIYIGRLHGKETYCPDETDPLDLSGVSAFVGDYAITEMAKWRMAALGKMA